MKTKHLVRLPTNDEQKVLEGLEVRLIRPQEQARFNRLLCEEHYLKNAHLVGDRLCYVAEYQGEWLALLTWSACSYHLKDREVWIGWTKDQRKRRRSLVVNNSRFLVLETMRFPNLASRAMGLCVKRLAQDWRIVFGHAVLVAESFVDSQLFRGTAYKASGWTLLGQTQGWGRTRQDFYVKHQRPKQLWVRELRPDARSLLCATTLAEEFGAAERKTPASCPFTVPELTSLLEMFKSVTDWRRGQARGYWLAGLLVTMAAAALCGESLGQRELAGFARGLSQGQRRVLRYARDKRKGWFKSPGETTFFRVLKHASARQVEAALLAFLDRVLGPVDAESEVVAFDGKELRHAQGVGIVSAWSVTHNRWLGSELGGKGGAEIPAVQRLLERTDLDGRVAVLDALHTQEQTTRQILYDQGGDYVLTVKDNQGGLRHTIETLTRQRVGGFSPSPGAHRGTQSESVGVAAG